MIESGALERKFKCPICNKQVERINDYLAQDSTERQLRIGLSNKRHHFAQHRRIKRAGERIVRFEEKMARAKSKEKYQEKIRKELGEIKDAERWL